ncbi:MAG: asparagine synthase-related protein [Candidatus Hermodarchaeota archaeon]
MAGIVGIAQEGRSTDIKRMLDKICHRGGDGRQITELDGATFGIVYPKAQSDQLTRMKIVKDETGEGHFARAHKKENNILLERDPLGISPLYYGYTEDKILCFASEVKALLLLTDDVRQVPPGHRYNGERTDQYFQLQKKPTIDHSPEVLAKKLYQLLKAAVKKYIKEDQTIIGSWLSGGLDSSTIAALVRPHVETLHTFAAGFAHAPDIKYAKELAEFVQSEHHEVIVSFDDIIAVLPKVIYHLESFDALLVRSTVTNYLASKEASKYVLAVFSGEGADELFAGYAYLKMIEPKLLPNELIDIIARLHNTALQRVDRSASAHGLVAYVPFLDPDVVDFALKVPVKYKLHKNIEKWIVRLAMEDYLPNNVLFRPKAKFWQGAGVGERLARYAEEQIDDTQFKQDRILPNGWVLNTKEELIYYRIFQEHFGDLDNLEWLGRTKGAPKIYS